jgi:hypothetical protein
MSKKVVLLFFLFCTILNSCKKNETSVQKNSPPEIESINFNPSNMTPGGKVQVTSVVVDQDGDPITYTWTSTDGVISDPNKATTFWTISPTISKNTSATIRLTVSDGKASVYKDQLLQIIAGITVTGYAYYSSTSIPVSGVTVSIGELAVTTGTDGFFSINNVYSGSNTIIASKTGYDQYQIIQNISNSNNNFTIPMTSSTETKRLYGTVKTIDNMQLFGIRVSILNPDGKESGLSDVSDVNGNYQLTSVPQGSRKLAIKNVNNPNLCLDTSYDVFLANFDKQYDPRIEIKRTPIEVVWPDSTKIFGKYTSIWNGRFALYGPGGYLQYKDYVDIPNDAQKLELYINTFVGNRSDQLVAIINDAGQTIGSYQFGQFWGQYFYAETTLKFDDFGWNALGKKISIRFSVNDSTSDFSISAFRLNYFY